MIGNAIKILNNDLTKVSSVYEPLLQPGVLSLHSSLFFNFDSSLTMNNGKLI